jgi:hypothetical protein
VKGYLGREGGEGDGKDGKPKKRLGEGRAFSRKIK